MRLAQGLTALAVVALLPFPAFADEPVSDAGRASRAKRVVVERQVAAYDYEVRPNLVPDCWEQFNATLLQCAPRTYVPPRDIDTLNELNGIPSRVVRPYPYLFSW